MERLHAPFGSPTACLAPPQLAGVVLSRQAAKPAGRLLEACMQLHRSIFTADHVDLCTDLSCPIVGLLTHVSTLASIT